MKKWLSSLLILSLLATDLHAAFGFYSSITVNGGQVPSTQSSFPMLVSGTFAGAGGIIDLRTTGNGGKVQNANGYDVGFYTNNNCSTGKLNWETETYNGTSGVVNYWVNIASIQNGSVIYLCAGDAGINTDQSNPTAVWDSDFKSVWHFPDGSTLSASDSTTNGNTGTITSATAGSGQIDGGGSYDGSTSRINFGTTNIPSGASAVTDEVWLNSAVNTGGYRSAVTIGDVTNASTGLLLMAHNGDGIIGLQSHFDTDAGLFNSAGWHHVVITYDGSTQKTYADGALLNSGAQTFNVQLGNSDSVVATGIDARPGVSDPLWDGLIDEWRISDIARPADWITTEYNNQSAPSSFYTVGAQTAVGGGGATPAPLKNGFGCCARPGILR